MQEHRLWINRSDSSTLFGTGDTTPGVLCPVLDPKH